MFAGVQTLVWQDSSLASAQTLIWQRQRMFGNAKLKRLLVNRTLTEY